MRTTWLIIASLVLILMAIGVWIGLSHQEPLQSEDQASAKPRELLIFSAVSLTDAFRELVTEFEAQQDDVEVVLNLASSGNLQIQIEQGAPADIFASAATRQMDALLEEELIAEGTVRIFARNRLVVAGRPEGSRQIKQPRDLLKAEIRQIGIGNPKIVPAGQYTVDVLRELQLWGPLQEKLVYGNHVRQVLQYVARGEVDLGFVYQTDLYQQSHVEAWYTIPELAHPPIEYPIGIVRGSDQQQLAEEFIKLARSQLGQEILHKYGFEVAE